MKNLERLVVCKRTLKTLLDRGDRHPVSNVYVSQRAEEDLKYILKVVEENIKGKPIDEEVERLILAKNSLENFLLRVEKAPSRNIHLSPVMKQDLNYILNYLDKIIKGAGNE